MLRSVLGLADTRSFVPRMPSIGGVAHTHSRHATAWAQACREIPCLETTYADYFCGSIPVAEALRPDEIDSDYEANTGAAIIRLLEGGDSLGCPAALVAGRAPFFSGKSVTDAVQTAVISKSSPPWRGKS